MDNGKWIMENEKIKAAFLDRDGVINIDKNYVHKIEDFEFKDGIFDLLKLLQDKGFVLFVVTNQSGIGRGYYTLEDFKKLTDYMLNELKKRGIKIKEVAFCPHHPGVNCECRKPKPGMILNLAKKYNIDLKHSILIGDKQSDIEAGKNAGVGKTYLVEDSLFDIIEKIKKE
ncbi:D-glycero-D-manno-heptose 1,7-bisphosphate phosphatase [Lebetimonas natsushimae]|uniref:D,D-heptose 1,7-bisphosphate phosphatase n=1 Tax=Lebetimonas natsushimae TaxID=1936991 RepID=A0A292YBW0_9BACT|nr:D-glycero-beta-D-manno-heptose 1,7-bisphosphate 7-phosphatase [Lebetimonas natsushimae]GAX86814.1 D-glycero-D-manno-heptose 1,7-bisphosphate phosphatase [Lebetimonas natsushimae]